MGQQAINIKSQLILHYYVFQKTIQKYLTDWKDKIDGKKIEKGYIIHPEWIKEWKKTIDYNNLKTNYLDYFNLESTNINEDQRLLIKQHLEPVFKDYKKISYSHTKDLLPISDNLLSLEYLENFCDEKTYNLFNANAEVEKIEYIFKKKMLFFFCKANNIIKIIIYNENKNNIINLKYIFYNINVYNHFVSMFEKKSSDKILDYLIKKKDILNIKKYVSHNQKTNKINYNLIYEGENSNLNINEITKNGNKINDNDSKLNSSMNQSEFSLLDNYENNNEISLSLNEKKTENEITENKKIKGKNEDNNKESLPEDNIIAVHFHSGDNRINRPIACKINNSFSKVEEKLYNEYPGVENDIDYFLVNGIQINRLSTLEENNIKDGDTIIICLKDTDTDTPCK